MKISGRCIYMIIPIFAILTIAYCDDEMFYDNIMNEDEIVDPHSIYFDRTNKMNAELDLDLNGDELMDPHSLYFDHRNKRMIKETDFEMLSVAKKVHGLCAEQCRSIKNVDTCNLQDKIFYKRLVNLILSNISIQKQSDDLIVGTLSIEMSPSQMETLRNFKTQAKSLREIDAILGDVIKEPQYSYVSVVTHIYDGLVRNLAIVVEMTLQYPQTAIIILTVLISYVALKYSNWQRGIPIFFIMQFLIVLSFFMTWWQLLQEAEIKYAATQMKYSEVPIACQPNKMNMWHKFVSLIYSDDCEKYYEAVMSNPKLKITPAFALSHFISTAVLHPVTNIGTAISSFVKNATHDLPWIYAWVVKLLLYISIGIGIIMLPFTLFGASIKMALGPLFKLGINCQGEKAKGKLIQDTEKREPIQIILQHIPGSTGAVASSNVLKIDEPKAIQAVPNTEREKEELEAIDDVQECTEDLSCGDRAICTKTKTDNAKKCLCSQDCDLTNAKAEDGSGDR